MAIAMKANEAFAPADIRLLGAQAVVLEADPVANLVEQPRSGGVLRHGEDELALTRPDPDSRAERRFLTLGVDAFGRHLIVVFTERGARIRIVSARLASKQERRAYEAGI
jgi:hypothetical protein